MSKFKVGDRIKIIGGEGIIVFKDTPWEIGDAATITDIINTGDIVGDPVYGYYLDGHHNIYFLEDELSYGIEIL